MGLSLTPFTIMHLLFLLSSSFNLIVAVTTNSISSTQPLCHDDERDALLQFKHSFSFSESAYGKVASWKIEGESGDCCSWDGVQCDENTGHVVSLDLSSSFLYGYINSTSSLFRLVHLLQLNLAHNDFNGSQIPRGIGHLSRLTSLNLSYSVFSGQIPAEISELTGLTSMDLSGNSLKLRKPNLRTLVQNLTSIKELDLSYVKISSQVPNIMANLSSLTSIFLRECGLYGEFPARILRLPKLQALGVEFNPDLTGNFPEFHHGNPLKYLGVGGTSFSGKLPDSIGNLNSLNWLNLSSCYFSGSIPASLDNLTQLTLLDLRNNSFTGRIPSLSSLTQLTSLSLSRTHISREIPSWLGRLSKLTELRLAFMNLNGEIPLGLANLTQLSVLLLSVNELTGPIPSWLGNITQLTVLGLCNNQLQGPMPISLYELKHLQTFDIGLNNLSGTIEVDNFLKLKNLTYFVLSDLKISHLTNYSHSNNDTSPKLKTLALKNCYLTEFPGFLRFQDELESLFLSHNKIQGQIPTWMWNASTETLQTLDLSNNFITGFEQYPIVLPWTVIGSLQLDSNMMQGSILIPPLSTFEYTVSDNKLSGAIPPGICRLTSLSILDFSNNNLSGVIPSCLGNFSNSLLVLNLNGNNLSGTIPQTFTNRSNLRMIDLSQNQLQGPLTRSLTNCRMLEILDLGNNRIDGTFPSWLGDLLGLQVLILRSNKFYGAIGSPKSNLEFSKLRIIDLSANGFIGDLPLAYFENSKAMRIADIDWQAYMKSNISFQMEGTKWSNDYKYSMTMINKGVKLVYATIPNLFTAVDLSSNKFKGQIPKPIGKLKGLQLLNLSNNDLFGCIPSSLGNLEMLESLDISHNKLSGGIPQQLTLLTFLEVLDVSYNNLSGSIPQGKQFDTFSNSSYMENFGLCGNPLSKKCGDSEESPQLPLLSKEGKDLEFPSKFDWIFICFGYGSGLVVGFVVGSMVNARFQQLFVKTFVRRQPKRRKKKRGQRN